MEWFQSHHFPRRWKLFQAQQLGIPSQTSSACSAQHLLPPSTLQELGIPNGNVHAPTTPWAKWYPWVCAWSKLNTACQQHSVSTMGVVPASGQNQQEGFGGDSRATSTACSALGATFKQKGGENKQLCQQLHRKHQGGSSHHRQLHILSESHVCSIARYKWILLLITNKPLSLREKGLHKHPFNYR